MKRETIATGGGFRTYVETGGGPSDAARVALWDVLSHFTTDSAVDSPPKSLMKLALGDAIPFVVEYRCGVRR